MNIKVLVVYYSDKQTFIQRDIDILKKHFSVEEFSFRSAMDIFSLTRKISKNDVVFVWFAGKHAGISVMLANILRKKSVVVVGGYDVVNIPEIEYGLWYWGSLADKWLCKYAIQHSSYVLVVSKTHENDMLKIARPKRYKVVYNGIPDNMCNMEASKLCEKENKIITVSLLKKDNIKRKRLDLYLKVAEYFPDYEFIIVGKPIDDTEKILKELAPENVKVLGFVTEEELRELYSKSKLYLQLSIHEAFGVAMVESMNCGCIPVASNRGALPEVVNGVGVVVNYGDLKSAVEGVKKGLEMAESCSNVERVVKRSNYFLLSKREREIVKIINELVT